MSFGMANNDALVGRTTSNTVQVAVKKNQAGAVVEMGTHGGMTETSIEEFSDGITNEATNGQYGSSVVSAHTFIESNTAYQRANKTTKGALAAAATTTTA